MQRLGSMIFSSAMRPAHRTSIYRSLAVTVNSTIDRVLCVRAQKPIDIDA